jgi:hypothetical protein
MQQNFDSHMVVPSVYDCKRWCIVDDRIKTVWRMIFLNFFEVYSKDLVWNIISWIQQFYFCTSTHKDPDAYMWLNQLSSSSKFDHYFQLISTEAKLLCALYQHVQGWSSRHLYSHSTASKGSVTSPFLRHLSFRRRRPLAFHVHLYQPWPSMSPSKIIITCQLII